MNGMNGWIGVDMDGTLAHYDGWKSDGSIGSPIPSMVERVKNWVRAGVEVRIFTARVDDTFRGGSQVMEQVRIIEKWCLEHLGFKLPITNRKDLAMIEFWDDRAIQIIPNTGARADGR